MKIVEVQFSDEEYKYIRRMKEPDQSMPDFLRELLKNALPWLPPCPDDSVEVTPPRLRRAAYLDREKDKVRDS